MGEVYRARDTRLDRTVALKVLPSEVSASGELRSRFERSRRVAYRHRLDARRTRPRLRGAPRRHPAALRARSRPRRGPSPGGHRRSAGAGCLDRRPLGGVLGEWGHQEDSDPGWPDSGPGSGARLPTAGHGVGSHGRLYYSKPDWGKPDNRVWRVAPETAPEPVTTLQQTELRHELPHVLPGEKALLFTVRRRTRTWGDEEVVAQDMATGVRKVLLRDAVDARYLRSGHLVFMRQGVLMAAIFDLDRLTVRGEPAPVLEGVAHALTGGNSGDATGAGQFAVSTAGTLAYLAGPVRPYPKERSWRSIAGDG